MNVIFNNKNFLKKENEKKKLFEKKIEYPFASTLVIKFQGKKPKI